ncbi:MAG: UDP-N-acetylmuramoyl-L-alanine--D-glutamate ligase [Eubacterium sp.]|nr:UDP-N-acetylmuramoyl-L-alanine--D-glutamate ligase [Eubacterium sp.]
MKNHDLKGKRVLVFGAGKSGTAACRLLHRIGAVPYLYDQKTEQDTEKLNDAIGTETEMVLGELPDSRLQETDLAVMSPGVPCDIPVVIRIRAAGIPVWSEIELAYRVGGGKVLAITGTNGKTTTTTLLGKIMSDYYPEVSVVGNIGDPYTDAAADLSEEAWTVAEISSFQLETIETFHPAGSVITNITEDHLNRHHTMEEYIRVKERIAENQTEADLCVLNYEDPVLRAFGETLSCRVLYFSSRRALTRGIYLDGGMIRLRDEGREVDIIRTDELQLLGTHNYENYMCAIALADFAGVPMEQIRRSCAEFKGVAHRIEFVGEKQGVRYYNDSKGTNPDAAIKAIQAMNRPTLLIGGGYDKESVYDEWIRSFEGKVRYLVLIGQTREKIARTAVQCGFPEEHILLRENLEEAVQTCADLARAGDAVLLSPACASWGQFKNYEERGDLFRAYADRLPD